MPLEVRAPRVQEDGCVACPDRFHRFPGRRPQLSTSRPSASTGARPRPRARSTRLPPVTRPESVAMDQPSSLQTKSTGRRHAEARFMLSMSMPWFMAPSPKNATASVPGRSRCAAIANPTPAGPRLPRCRRRLPGAPGRTGACARPARRTTPAACRAVRAEGRRVDAAHEQGRGAAVVEGHGVAVDEVRDDPCGDRLLAGAEVHLAEIRPSFQSRVTASSNRRLLSMRG